MQCLINDMTMKSSSYKGGSMINKRKSEEIFKVFFIRNLFECIVYIICIRLNKLFLWPLLLRWAMWPMCLFYNYFRFFNISHYFSEVSLQNLKKKCCAFGILQWEWKVRWWKASKLSSIFLNEIVKNLITVHG